MAWYKRSDVGSAPPTGAEEMLHAVLVASIGDNFVRGANSRGQLPGNSQEIW